MASGEKWRMRCIGKAVREPSGAVTGVGPGCGWRGVRTHHLQCECYDIWRMYCRPLTPGPGCPSGIVSPCPRCRGAVTGKPVEHRAKAGTRDG